MIIRLTVNDNDFSEIIEKFFKDFVVRMFELHPDSCINENDYEALKEWRKRESEIRRLLNPNNEIELTKENKETIINQTVRVFKSYIERWAPEDLNYLMKKLDVKIVDSVADKWENGEVFYWFQHSGIAINL